MNNSENVLAFLAKTLLAQSCLICKSQSADLACGDCSSLLCTHCGKEHGCGEALVSLRQIHTEKSESIATPRRLNGPTSQPFEVSQDFESEFVDLDQVEDLKEEVSLLRQQIGSLNSIVDQLNSELFLSNSEIDRLKRNNTQVVSDLNERLSLTESETVSLSARLRAANEHISHLTEQAKQGETDSVQPEPNSLPQPQPNEPKETPQPQPQPQPQPSLPASAPESDIYDCNSILRTGLIWSGLVTALAVYRLSLYVSDPRGLLASEGQNCLMKAISI